MSTVAATSIEPLASEPEANKLFRMVMKHKGSDLHLKVGNPPAMRLSGVLRQMQMPPLTAHDMERLMFPLLTTRQREILDTTGGSDFAHIVTDADGTETRFRVNLFSARGRLSLVARRVNTSIPNFEGLGLPAILSEIVKEDQGIIILAGVTGSGQVDHDRLDARLREQATERCHVVTIEDPIEFTFKDDKCIINQREVGIDVDGLGHRAEARGAAGPPTSSWWARCGIATPSTPRSMPPRPATWCSGRSTPRVRPLDREPHPRPVPGGHARGDEDRTWPSTSSAVIAQKLLPTTKEWNEKKGQSRVPLCEIMRMNPIVRKLILSEEDIKLAQAIRMGRSRRG